MKRKPFGAARDEEVPVRLLAESDSLFITCQGLTLHYKLSLPGSPPSLSLSSSSFVEPSSVCYTSSMSGGLSKFNRQLPYVSSKIQRQLYRTYSNQFNDSSLYAPLLYGPVTSPPLSEDIPVLHLDEIGEYDETVKSDTLSLDQKLEGMGQVGIVLIHGFGGGVFSWRHIMNSLARQSNCTVAAFDRPGWGLTSRLRREDWEKTELPNPYKLETQVIIIYPLHKLF